MKETISKDKFCNLYGECKDLLYRYAFYKLGSREDAEDAVSDAVLAAWRSRSSLKSEAAFSSWMFTILRNNCNGRIKNMMRDREKLERAAYSAPAFSSIDLSPSLSIELKEALNQLEDQEKEVVLLSVVAGLTSREIAKISGMTAGSVRSKLSRSLAKMREFLS